MKPSDVILRYFESQRDLEGIQTLTSDVLAALGAAGYAIVPKEPTEKMIMSGACVLSAFEHVSPELAQALYKDMLGACQ